MDPTFVLLIIVATVLLSATVGLMISMILKVKKGVLCSRIWICLTTVLSMLLVALSWVLNFGWIRFFLTLLLFPLIHGIAFLVSNIVFSKYANRSHKMVKLNLLYIASYLISYIFMPDGGDIGGLYFFFGLIHNDVLSYIAAFISYLAFIGQILFFVLQIDKIRMIKKNDLRN